MGKARLETDYLLALRPEPSRPDGPSVAQRMRQLLKVARRTYGFRCVRIAPDLPGVPTPTELDQDTTETTS